MTLLVIVGILIGAAVALYGAMTVRQLDDTMAARLQRFDLKPAGSLAELELQIPRVERILGPPRRRIAKRPSGAPRTSRRLYPPNFTLAVGPDKPVTGVVRDAATGVPLPGVRVRGASRVDEFAFGTYHFHAWPTPVTTCFWRSGRTLSLRNRSSSACGSAAWPGPCSRRCAGARATSPGSAVTRT